MQDRNDLYLNASMARLERSLEGLRKTFNDRFDQQTELLKSSFRTLSLEIQSLKKS